MPNLRLRGCSSRPLLGYLKALGVLRVVAGQADRGTRGRWRAGVFELRSDLDAEQLTRFLLHEYAPAPVVSPWNGGSGFHPKDDKEAVLALERSDDERLAAYRATIGAARRALARRELADKPGSGDKLPLVRELRRTLPDEALPWLDAAIVVVGDAAAYPPLLGSGGNDGRYDFSNNYAQAVVRCLLRNAWRSGVHRPAPLTSTPRPPFMPSRSRAGALRFRRSAAGCTWRERDRGPGNTPRSIRRLQVAAGPRGAPSRLSRPSVGPPPSRPGAWALPAAKMSARRGAVAPSGRVRRPGTVRRRSRT